MSNDLQRLIRSGNTLISIETVDESRALDVVRGMAGQMRRTLWEWSVTKGLAKSENGRVDTPIVPASKPHPALEYILQKREEKTIYLMKDLGQFCKDAVVYRLVRDVLNLFDETKSTLIFVDALPLPDEIKPFVVRHDLGWPTEQELEVVLKQTFQRIKQESYEDVNAKLSKRDAEQIVQTLRGLTCAQAERIIASAILDDMALTADDLKHIIESKRTLLGSSGCLETIAADVNATEIGGLGNLKRWLQQRRGGFNKQAIEFGLESPRGILMLGVPGCGKSLCAKVVAADWGMPLLRLDPGVLYQRFVGESESQLRQALRQAQSMAPVVLWIDEIEKAFASASAASADGGLSQRMFGTLLSWMQDHRHPIFIIATSNDISALPPELMRKGRFDEVFFVDLPDLVAREQILRIHLKRRRRDPDAFNLLKLAKAAEGFSGSELEQVVLSALFAAYSRQSELEDRDLLQEIGNTRPLSVLNAEKIDRLRAWAENRCVSAD